MEEGWTCRKCGRALEMKRMLFEYLGNTINHELPACPVCGSVFVPKELAEGKIAETEVLLEDK